MQEIKLHPILQNSHRYQTVHCSRQGNAHLFNIPVQPRPTVQGGQKFTIRCAYCEEFHYSASCPKVVDPAKRKHRCLICLRVGHRARRLKHAAIVTKVTISPSAIKVQQIKKPALPVANEKSEISQVSATAALRKRGTVLLQTATAVATNEDGTKVTKVRILFDSGSHRSYVTNDLKSRFNLNSYKTEMLNLNTFGEQKYRKQSCKLVKVRLSKPGLNEEVEVLLSYVPLYKAKWISMHFHNSRPWS